MGLHIPEAYGGSAAGSLAFCLAAEEVAWACASTSTIFLVQNLGGYPIIFGGSEEQKRRYLPRLATGEMTAAFSLSEPGSGSDAAGHDVPRGAQGRPLRAERLQDVGDQRLARGRHHRVRHHRAGPAGQGRDRAPGGARPEGLHGRQARAQAGHPRLAHGGAPLQRLRGAGGEPARRGGRGVQGRDEDPRAVAAHHRGPGGGHRPGRPRRRGRLRAGAAGLRPAHRPVPGHPVHARRHGDGGARLAPGGAPRGGAHRSRGSAAPRSRPRPRSAWPPTPP